MEASALTQATPEDCLPGRPRERAAAEEVDVEMKDGLSGAGADVEDGAVSLLDLALACDLGGGKVATADDFCVGRLGLFQSGKMFLGNDENVRGSLRLDVFKGEDMVVLVNLFGGDLAANHSAEEAVGIGHRDSPGGNDNTLRAGLSPDASRVSIVSLSAKC